VNSIHFPFSEYISVGLSIFIPGQSKETAPVGFPTLHLVNLRTTFALSPDLSPVIDRVNNSIAFVLFVTVRIRKQVQPSRWKRKKDSSTLGEVSYIFCSLVPVSDFYEKVF
jgi:hypothetical protein